MQQNQTPLNFVSWHIYSSDPRAIRASIDGVRARLAKYPALKPETILNEWNLDLGLPPKDPPSSRALWRRRPGR